MGHEDGLEEVIDTTDELQTVKRTLPTGFTLGYQFGLLVKSMG